MKESLSPGFQKVYDRIVAAFERDKEKAIQEALASPRIEKHPLVVAWRHKFNTVNDALLKLVQLHEQNDDSSRPGPHPEEWAEAIVAGRKALAMERTL